MILGNRFWSKVKKTPNGCWEWTASLANYGYGQFYWKGKPERAHRLTFIEVNGEIPEGMYVLHKCDNPCCVNPNHLFLGTHQDNMDDMLKKSRNARGETNGQSKLKESEVSDIRAEYRDGGITQYDLAAYYKVDQSQISYVINNKTWKHLEKKVA